MWHWIQITINLKANCEVKFDPCEWHLRRDVVYRKRQILHNLELRHTRSPPQYKSFEINASLLYLVSDDHEQIEGMKSGMERGVAKWESFTQSVTEAAWGLHWVWSLSPSRDWTMTCTALSARNLVNLSKSRLSCGDSLLAAAIPAVNCVKLTHHTGLPTFLGEFLHNRINEWFLVWIAAFISLKICT